jgi:hypothetical protein
MTKTMASRCVQNEYLARIEEEAVERKARDIDLPPMSDDEEYEESEEEGVEGQVEDGQNAEEEREVENEEERKEAAESEHDAQADDAEAQKLLRSLGAAGGSMSLAAQLAMDNDDSDEEEEDDEEREDAQAEGAAGEQVEAALTKRLDSSEAEDAEAQVDLDGVLKLDSLRIASEQAQQLAESTTATALTAVSKHARMELTPDLLKAWERDSKAAEDELAQELTNSTV